MIRIVSRSLPQVNSNLPLRFCSTFKSFVHTDNLYPGSKEASKFAKFDLEKLPTKNETFSGYIPMNEIEFSYGKSSGPGGQNVNKVNMSLCQNQ